MRNALIITVLLSFLLGCESKNEQSPPAKWHFHKKDDGNRDHKKTIYLGDISATYRIRYREGKAPISVEVDSVIVDLSSGDTIDVQGKVIRLIMPSRAYKDQSALGTFRNIKLYPTISPLVK